MSRKSLMDYEVSDNYVSLNDLIRQSQYFQKINELIISCDDLDGLPESIPIIFEENYLPLSLYGSTSSSLASQLSAFTNNNNNSGEQQSITITNLNLTNSAYKDAGVVYTKQPMRSQLNSINFSENSSRSNSTSSKKNLSRQELNSESGSSLNENSISSSSKNLHKKLKKKLTHGDLIESIDKTNKSITLVSYRKVNDELGSDQTSLINSSTNSIKSTSTTTSATNISDINNQDNNSSTSTTTTNNGKDTQSKLLLIKADLANANKSAISTPYTSAASTATALSSSSSVSTSNSKNASSSNNISNSNKGLHSIIESTVTNYAASATDLLFGQSFCEKSTETPKKLDKQLSLKSEYDEPFGHSTILEQNNQKSLSNNDLPSFDVKNGLFNLNGEVIQERGIDVNDLLEGMNQVDVSLASETSSVDRSLNQQQNADQSVSFNVGNDRNETSASKAAAAVVAIEAIDCSVKSKALYESFRGKVSTLERPKNTGRRSMIKSASSMTGCTSSSNPKNNIAG
jgi:hypothetical protein